MYSVPQGRLRPKKESTFGKVKKPFKGKNKNRKGDLKNSFSHQKLKPKSEPEPDYMSWFHESYKPPCFVCGARLGIEFHHVKEHSTDDRIDSIGMPLCWEHHHGYTLSPHGSPVKFKEVYPMSVQLEYAANMYSIYLAEKL